MTRIVTGLFQQRRDADLVVEHLVQEFDIPRERIQVHATDVSSGEEARSAQDDNQEASLPDLGLPDDALRAYGEGIRHGGILVTAWVDDDHVGHAGGRGRLPGVRRGRSAGAPGPVSRRGGWPGAADPEVGLPPLGAGRSPRGSGPGVLGPGSPRHRGGDRQRAPREFAGETGAAPLPEQDRSPEA